MKLVTQLLASAVIAAGLFFSGIWLASTQQQPQQKQLGATFTPAQIPQSYLSGAGVTSSQTTVPLTSFATRDGRAVTMSMFGSIAYGTLEPGTSKEEIVSFTGVTQNSNGTASLTGVSRGLDFISPYAASTTLQKSHAGNATFIVTNTAPFYGQQFAFTNNPTTIAAVWTFGSTTNPVLDADLASWVAQPAAALASKGYVDSVAVAGAPNANATTKGIVQLATALQAASSTNAGSTGAIDVLQSKYATDTPQNCSTASTGGCIPMTLLNGKLAQAWLDLTQTFSWTNVGTSTFAGGLYSSLFAAPYFDATSTTATSTFAGGVLMKNASTTNFEVGGICTNCAANGYEQITNTGAGPTVAGNNVNVTATCSTGKRVIAGGGDDTIGDQTILFEKSIPSAANQWTVRYTSATGGSAANTITAYAICVNP